MSSPPALAVRSARRRASVAAELVRSGALRRAIRWEPAVAGCAAAGALLAWRHDTPAPLGLLRGLSLAVVLGVLFVLDDPAARMIEAAPMPWRYRLTLRVLVALGIAGPAFLALGAVLAPDVGIGAGVGLEVATVLAIGLAGAAVAFRFWEVDAPGLVTAPIVLGFLGGLALVPPRWALIVVPGPQWPAAHLRWAGVLIAAAVLVALASRDPAARRYRARSGA